MFFIASGNWPINRLNNIRGIASSRWLLALFAIALVFFSIGYSGALQKLAKSGTYFFHLYAEAELEKLQASGFVNEDGEPEYVVSIVQSSLAKGRESLARLKGVARVRDTLFEGWFVVALEAGNTRAIETVKSADFVEFALPNRGVWFCH